MKTIVAAPPASLGSYYLQTEEQMNYLYYPVAMRECDTGVDFWRGIRLEPRMEPALQFVYECWHWAMRNLTLFDPKAYYCYLSMKIGFATTENPLNRPGWHIDAWGHPEDHNFVWADEFPTRYITGNLYDVPDDDAGALKAFEVAGRRAEDIDAVHEVQRGSINYFHQTCVHATPIISKPGMRKFLKVSLSPHRYNLSGNSKNSLLVYDWPMADRQVTRNDPVAGNGDFA